jgi:hypothetical protein
VVIDRVERICIKVPGHRSRSRGWVNTLSRSRSPRQVSSKAETARCPRGRGPSARSHRWAARRDVGRGDSNRVDVVLVSVYSGALWWYSKMSPVSTPKRAVASASGAGPGPITATGSTVEGQPLAIARACARGELLRPAADPPRPVGPRTEIGSAGEGQPRSRARAPELRSYRREHVATTPTPTTRSTLRGVAAQPARHTRRPHLRRLARE